MARLFDSMSGTYSSVKFYSELVNSKKDVEDVLTVLNCLPFEPFEIKETKAVYNKLDLFLVYLHTFFALSNIYGTAVSAYIYAQELNIKPELSGVIQAAVPIGSFCFGFVWNYVTGFKSYKLPFLFSIFLMFASSILYYFVQNLKKEDGSVSINGLILLVPTNLIP